MTEELPLARRSCVPCKGGVPPMPPGRVAELLKQLAGWDSFESKRLGKTFKTKNFETALELVNRIGRLAEDEGHHPDIAFGWGRVTIELWTHKIGGLTESDFILAAKIDELAR